jgi:hypothetical protein
MNAVGFLAENLRAFGQDVDPTAAHQLAGIEIAAQAGGEVVAQSRSIG